MITPYLVYKEMLPCGRLAWRRAVNPAFSQVPAVDVAYHLKSHLDFKSVDLTSKIIHHKPEMVLGQSFILPNLVVNLPSQKGH